MDQERKGEMKGIMRKCHGKGDKINSHEKIEKKNKERMCSNIKNYSSPEETEKVDNIDMVRKGNTDAEREGSGEDNSTDGRRNKKRSPRVQRAARQRHRALLSSTYQ